MSRRRPKLIHPSPDSSPVPSRTAWWLIAGGTAAIFLGTGLSIVFSTGFVPLGLLGGLAFTLGICGLAERKLVALPAFVVGFGATFLLTFGGHAVLMDRIGHVERCAVTTAQEYRSAKYPSVDYVLACPSGAIELSRDYADRLRGTEADVRIGPPLRPVFADETTWNPLVVVGVLVAMIVLVPTARALRGEA